MSGNNSNAVTSLSMGKIASMYIDDGTDPKKQKLVVQFLGLERKNEKRLMMTVSDGSLQLSAAPYKNISEKLNTMPPKENSILEVELLFHKRQLFIILDYREIYGDVSSLIGEPISHEQFIQAGSTNQNEASSIPASVYNLLTSNFGSQNSQMLDEAQTSQNNRPTSRPIKKAIHIEEEDIYTAISLIDTNSKSWICKVRCTNKSAKRIYSNARGEGAFFNCVFQDDSNKVIQATFFNAQCDKYYDFLVDGNVYSISYFTVQRASRYNKTNNDVELIGNKATRITQLEDDESVPQEKFDFVTVGSLKAKSLNTEVNLLAVVDKIEEPSMITLKKTGEQKKKTSLFLMDDTGFTVKVDIWGENSTLDNLSPGQLIVLKKGVVREFKNEKHVSFTYSSKLITAIPKISRANILINWRSSFDKSTLQNLGGEGVQSKQSRVKFLKEIKAESRELEFNALGKLYFSSIVYVTSFRKQLYYDACSTPNCLKKVREQDGSFMCDKCGKEIEHPQPRFMSTVQLSDASGSIYATVASDEVGQSIFGMDINELKSQKLASEEQLFEYLERDQSYKSYYVRLMAKLHTYNGKSNVRFTALKSYSSHADFMKQNKVLLNTLRSSIEQ